MLDSLVLPEVSAEAMSIFLQEVSLRHLDESIIIFLDGAGWHKAKDLKIPDNIKLSKLPPYSPELNPTEHIWEEIREKWFENKVFLSIDGVVDTLEQALHTLENDNERVQSLSEIKKVPGKKYQKRCSQKLWEIKYFIHRQLPYLEISVCRFLPLMGTYFSCFLPVLFLLCQPLPILLYFFLKYVQNLLTLQ